MEKKIIIAPKQIVTVNNDNEVLRNHAIEVVNGKIKKISHLNDFELSGYDGDYYEFNNLTLIPAFVQTHIHLCQTLFRGLADDLELLDWLQKRIFPYENAHTKESLKASVRLGIHELISNGTTTILDMGTINHQEVVFDELINSQMRAHAGKCMVDQNQLLPQFKETTEESLRTTYDLAKSYHNKENGNIKYGFAPRFVLSCSEKLLKDTHQMMEEFEDSIYHTHASENEDEINVVRKMHSMENIEYFNSIGVMDDRTFLAHCIHLNDDEVELLNKTGTRVSHCPSSNLKLGSGIANIPKYLNKNISVSLGADGAPCNNNLDIFTEMRLSALIQKPIHGSTVMDALTVFRLATIEGAKALHREDEVGSIEVGKYADFVLLDLERVNQSLLDEDSNIYSNIVYSAGRENVKHVLSNGTWLLKDGISTLYDEKELVSDGRAELEKLLDRAK